MTTRSPADKLIVALDFPTSDPALAVLDQLGDAVCWYKVGLELYMAAGVDFVRCVRDRGKNVFLDLKFHDIPNTVAGVARGVGALGVQMFNVHAAGGMEMMRAAKAAAAEGAAAAGRRAPAVYGVTVLTSLDDEGVRSTLRQPGDAADTVLHWAELTARAGLDGVVASPQEIRAVRSRCGPAFGVLTPGIRPAGAGSDDQRRVGTPAAALRAGATYLVVGRPITKATDPRAAAQDILAEMTGAQ